MTKLAIISYEIIPNLKEVHLQNGEDINKISKTYHFIPKQISSEISRNLEEVCFKKRKKKAKLIQATMHMEKKHNEHHKFTANRWK